MRIVSGSLRGRNIITPDGRGTRPTSDQTRESLFNILGHASWAPAVNGAIIADMFAGSGALGLEAISRGADFALFVENHPKALAAIRANIVAMKLTDKARALRQDARKLRLAPSNMRGKFTHVYMDPPYDKGLWLPALGRLRGQDLLADDAVIILETSSEEEVAPRGFDILDQRMWGAAKVTFLKALA